MKKVILCIVFCLLNLLILYKLNDVLISKELNRYYILDKYLEENNEEYDIHVYGSCHSYTSFNPSYLKNEYNLDAFVYGNPGETMPLTYLRMLNKFKDYKPKTAFVEIWGINPYETYDETEKILGDYFESNLERIPFSKEKIEVIKDFNKDFIDMNIHISKYKDRIMTNSLYNNDFKYSFLGTKERSSYYVYSEMESRINNRGFRAYESKEITDYNEKQAKINDNDYMKIEEDIYKYIIKIIELCKEYNVELIFYRSPYVSSENELKKVKHFKEICNEYNIPFVDLEEVIKFDYKVDFYDYFHLSEKGANKATKYLIEEVYNM